ncbi:HEAT repeat domain-containing protein [Acinetobacter sp. C26M]|uniref:HEAT repeat domain-containing protein n=1 Tax=unclassified Acinetobacter TaxID=196816 RepID=UPI0020369276|nr:MULTISPECIES: HEAT repeat domain-containing protein [unclassified Acinetobacter]USA47194.1 HEAT repeat domain-containing protein [Acinetobacter sp. C26M]USA50675.1 HEAT repeat domain-containing protein [Acinetobacter sp. C26G]
MAELIKRIRITYKIKILGMSEIAFPIDIISLSREIADLKSTEDSHKIIEAFKAHKNAFVRRVIVTAIRFMGQNSSLKYIGYLLEKIEDEDDWVKYDVAWTLGELDCNDKRVINSLTHLAEEYFHLSKEELEKIEPNDACIYAKKRAAESLHELSMRF